MTSIVTPGAESSGQPGADLEAEQAAAEQHVRVALVADHLRHRVDDRLREALGRRLRAVDLLHSVGAERLAGVVGDLADDDRGGVAADLAGKLATPRTGRRASSC